MNAIVRSALALFDGRLEGVQVFSELCPGLPKVMADPEGMKRAVANLVDNAAEAMANSLVREIHLSTALLADKDMVEITVADSGSGVSRELKERLLLFVSSQAFSTPRPHRERHSDPVFLCVLCVLRGKKVFRGLPIRRDRRGFYRFFRGQG